MTWVLSQAPAAESRKAVSVPPDVARASMVPPGPAARRAVPAGNRGSSRQALPGPDTIAARPSDSKTQVAPPDPVPDARTRAEPAGSGEDAVQRVPSLVHAVSKVA